MSLLKAIQQREAQKADAAGTSTPSNQVNSLRQPGGGGRGETVQYVNQHDGSDSDG